MLTRVPVSDMCIYMCVCIHIHEYCTIYSVLGIHIFKHTINCKNIRLTISGTVYLARKESVITTTKGKVLLIKCPYSHDISLCIQNIQQLSLSLPCVLNTNLGPSIEGKAGRERQTEKWTARTKQLTKLIHTHCGLWRQASTLHDIMALVVPYFFT